MNITASDRSALLNLAASLPKGDGMRRAILSGLKRVSAGDKATAHLYPFLGKHKKLFEDFVASPFGPLQQDLADEGELKAGEYGKWTGRLPAALEEFGAEHPNEADEVMIAWASKKTGIPKAKLKNPDVFSVGREGIVIDLKAARKTASVPTRVSLSDLNERGYGRPYRAIWPTNADPDLGDLSKAKTSVFYLTSEGYLIVVLASKRKALLWTSAGYGSTNGRFTDTTAWYLAKERKSLLGALKENQDTVELGGSPHWVEIQVTP